MAKYMGRKELSELVDCLVNNPQYKGNLMNPDSARAHIMGVSDKAVQITQEAFQHYPFLDGRIDIGLMRVGGAGHDFGRPLEKDQNIHGLRSALLIEERGLELGIADNIVDIYIIAQIARSHGLTLEEAEFVEKNFPEEMEKFRPLHPILLAPRTWQELIVTAADFYDDGKGGFANPQERIKGVKERYVPGSEYARTNSSLANAIRNSSERIFESNRMLERLSLGDLNEGEIARYGFI